MATKTQRFKTEMQREAQASHAKKVEAHPSRRRPPNGPDGGPAAHNQSARAGKNAAYELEVSGAARPPRKSTRRSPTHQKTDSSLRITQMIRNASSKSRAGRPSGNPM